MKRGFTLVELLVALTVFAAVGFTVTSRVGDVSGQIFGLERRTMAHWVADNHMNRLRLARRATTEPLPTGRERERVYLGNREWRIDVNIEDTTHPWLRRVELEVYEVRDTGDVGPVETLVAFLGRY